MNVRWLPLVLVLSLSTACAPEPLLRTLGFGPLLDANDADDRDTPPRNDERIPARPAPDVPGVVDLETVADFCARNPDAEQAPGLLPLPEVDALPAWCDEDLARADFVAACGEPARVEVAPGELSEAVDACQGACHFLLGAGTYRGVGLPGCSILEGIGAGETRIEGQVYADRGQTIIARVAITDAGGALYAENDALITESVLVGGYEGAGAAWSAEGFRVCRTAISAGYGGLGLAWESRGLRVAGSSIAACYEGIGGSWGSSDIDAVGNFIFGEYSAIGTSWGTVDLLIEDNTLASSYAAVDVHLAGNGGGEDLPERFDVIIRNNNVLSGDLPEASDALNIVVEGNSSP